MGKEIRIIVIAARKKPMNYTQQVRDIKSILLRNCPKGVTPECFYRGRVPAALDSR